MAAGVADVFEIVVLAAGADAFLRGGGARVIALFQPEETSLNWFMPALVNSSVGSLAGTSDELRTIRWPCPEKNCRNFSRISFPVIIYIQFRTWMSASAANGRWGAT